MGEKMLIQDVYILGVKLHNILHKNRISFAKTQEEFDDVWQKSIKELQDIVERQAIDLYGNVSDISWSYRQPNG